jgi:hypothetical protein
MASFRTGTKVVAAAGTRVQLTDTTSNPATGARTVAIQALSTNTGAVTVGDANVVAAVGTQGTPTQRGIRLTAGQILTVDLTDITSLWLDCATSGDGVSWLVGAA